MSGFNRLILETDSSGKAVFFPGQQAVIGRAGNFEVGGDDQNLHRQFLQIWNSSGAWLIFNCGSSVTAYIYAVSGGWSETVLAPKAQTTLPAGSSYIMFRTPGHLYEVRTIAEISFARPDLKPGHGKPTNFRQFDPNPEQHQLLLHLARPLLARPAGTAEQFVPTVSQVAKELGWTRNKTERKIELLDKKLRDMGEPGFAEVERTSVKAHTRLARYGLHNYWRLRKM